MTIIDDILASASAFYLIERIRPEERYAAVKDGRSIMLYSLNPAAPAMADRIVSGLTCPSMELAERRLVYMANTAYYLDGAAGEWVCFKDRTGPCGRRGLPYEYCRYADRRVRELADAATGQKPVFAKNYDSD